MSQTQAFPQRCSSISVRTALGNPEKALVVEIEAVRKGEKSSTETFHKVPIQVEFKDRVQVGISALIAATAV